MALPLLATKTRVPPLPQQLVQRAWLSDSLEHRIPHYRLVLIAAPAGYGKTTLLTQWAHSSRFAIAWLSLSEEDNDPDRFLRYLLAAWEQVQPGITDSSLGILLKSLAPDREAVLSTFINIGNERSEHIVFVLDDYNLIEDPSVHEALTFLLDHLPPTLHFVLAGRGEPPLPLAAYRTRSQMLAYDATDLRFSGDETAEFFNVRAGSQYRPGDIEAVQAHLEGWIAGIQLLALSLRRRPEDYDELAVSGRHRYIADYLQEAVLSSVRPDVRQFLLQTSILDRLSGPLCDALTGKSDGQEMLEHLQRENLFLLPLDDRREWFRYHRLFADFLQKELTRRREAEVKVLHRRAAGWYLARSMAEKAFSHAVEAEEGELVLQIFERHAQIKLTGGEFSVLKRWLDALPESWTFDFPIIGLVRTGFLLFTGQLEACRRCIEEVEQRVASAESNDTRRQLARVSAVRCSIACFQNDLARAKRLADKALLDLPDEDHLFRAMIFGSLGDVYRRNSYWRQARECYEEMLDFIHEPTFRVQSVHVFGALADLDLRQGRLRDAARSWRQALEVIEERENWGRFPLPLVGWVYVRMGELLYEWNDLASAWDHLSQGLERAELGGDVRAMIAGYLIAGRLKLTEGDSEAAAEYLERARPLVEDTHFPDWTARFQRLQLELWLAQDRLRAAVNWSDEMAQDDGQGGAPAGAPRGGPESEVAQLAMARVLLVKGDLSSLQQALALLDRLLQRADTEGRTGLVVEALALQALGQRRRGDTAGAMTSLERALRLGEPEGYVRLFADLGLPMGRLIQEAHSRDVMVSYVEKVLAAFRGDLAVPALEQEALPEPLTDREQEVLELLAAGLTNREVAEQLAISPLTVKTHAGNIYGKLGVSNRTEAAARARELELLE